MSPILPDAGPAARKLHDQVVGPLGAVILRCPFCMHETEVPLGAISLSIDTELEYRTAHPRVRIKLDAIAMTSHRHTAEGAYLPEEN